MDTQPLNNLPPTTSPQLTSQGGAEAPSEPPKKNRWIIPVAVIAGLIVIGAAVYAARGTFLKGLFSLESPIAPIIEIETLKSDLVIDSMTATYTTQGTLSITLQPKNIGSITYSGPYSAAFSLEGEEVLISDYIGNLAPGTTEIRQAVISKEKVAAHPNATMLKAVVDSKNQVDEANETNNSLEVSIEKPLLPNLELFNVNAKMTAQGLSVTYGIRNIGTAAISNELIGVLYLLNEKSVPSSIGHDLTLEANQQGKTGTELMHMVEFPLEKVSSLMQVGANTLFVNINVTGDILSEFGGNLDDTNSETVTFDSALVSAGACPTGKFHLNGETVCNLNIQDLFDTNKCVYTVTDGQVKIVDLVKYSAEYGVNDTDKVKLENSSLYQTCVSAQCNLNQDTIWIDGECKTVPAVPAQCSQKLGYYHYGTAQCDAVNVSPTTYSQFTETCSLVKQILKQPIKFKITDSTNSLLISFRNVWCDQVLLCAQKGELYAKNDSGTPVKLFSDQSSVDKYLLGFSDTMVSCTPLNDSEIPSVSTSLPSLNTGLKIDLAPGISIPTPTPSVPTPSQPQSTAYPDLTILAGTAVEKDATTVQIPLTVQNNTETPIAKSGHIIVYADASVTGDTVLQKSDLFSVAALSSGSATIFLDIDKTLLQEVQKSLVIVLQQDEDLNINNNEVYVDVSEFLGAPLPDTAVDGSQPAIPGVDLKFPEVNVQLPQIDVGVGAAAGLDLALSIIDEPIWHKGNTLNITVKVDAIGDQKVTKPISINIGGDMNKTSALISQATFKPAMFDDATETRTIGINMDKLVGKYTKDIWIALSSTEDTNPANNTQTFTVPDYPDLQAGVSQDPVVNKDGSVTLRFAVKVAPGTLKEGELSLITSEVYLNGKLDTIFQETYEFKGQKSYEYEVTFPTGLVQLENSFEIKVDTQSITEKNEDNNIVAGTFGGGTGKTVTKDQPPPVGGDGQTGDGQTSDGQTGDGGVAGDDSGGTPIDGGGQVVYSGGGGGGGGAPLPSSATSLFENLAKGGKVKPKKSADEKKSLPYDPAAPFQDTKKHWALKQVSVLYNLKVVSGYNPKLYGPNDTLTRSQMVKIALNTCEIPVASKVTKPPAKDMSIKNWAAPYVAKAKELGIVSGYSDGKFKPEAPVTRAEALKILSKACTQQLGTLKLSAAEDDAPSLKDVKGKEWYASFVLPFVQAEIVQGYSDKTFRPDNSITRAEMSKIAVRLLQNIYGLAYE